MKWFIILLPWLELYTLIELGGNIGAFGALAYVFLTLALGLSIMRLQFAEVIRRFQVAQNEGLVAGHLIAGEMAVGLAGLLLVVPGLITDSLAVVVLLALLLRRITGRQAPERVRPMPTTDDAEPLEGEYRRLDPE